MGAPFASPMMTTGHRARTRQPRTTGPADRPASQAGAVTPSTSRSACADRSTSTRSGTPSASSAVTSSGEAGPNSVRMTAARPSRAAVCFSSLVGVAPAAAYSAACRAGSHTRTTCSLAFRSLASSAAQLSAALTVCHACAPGFPVPSGEATAFDLARRSGERVIASGLQHAQRVMGSGQVRSLLLEGPAAAAFCERSHGADMAVVGSPGHAGVAGLLLGSVSSQVAAHAPGRVVVVRGHWRPAAGYAPGPIVAGVDGSAASRAAVAFACEEAALRHAPLLTVCALADTPAGPVGARRLLEGFD